MPRRNLLILLLVMLVAVLCRQQVQTNPYIRVLAGAISAIEQRALDPTSRRQLFEGAMDGMMDRLDKNSKYFSPAELKDFHEDIDLQFAGVGMEVGIDPKTKELMVFSPVANSPAAKAGTRAGDRILRIDKTDTRGMSLADASALLRGKKGTAVTLTILHQGEDKPQQVTIVRQNVQGDSVRGDTRNADGSWNFFLDGHDRIGYVRITTFTDNTVNELRQALAWMTEHGMRGLVLDLRDDPGGYLDAAVAVCDLLIPSGEIVTTRDREGHIGRAYFASSDAPFVNFPIAVIVDQQTASAAEIVAACLQDHRRAVVVGQRTYGKGTVQDLIDLEPGCGAMKLTTKSYWRPSGKDIQRPRNASGKDHWGVSPDKGFKVALSDEQADAWRQWRARRDVHQPPEKNAAGDTKPFVDRQRLRAVECVEQAARRTPTEGTTKPCDAKKKN